jgi:hypothetical protein
MVQRATGERSMVALEVYPDTHHAFLMSARAGLQYNETATQDASKRLRGFFERMLDREIATHDDRWGSVGVDVRRSWWACRRYS